MTNMDLFEAIGEIGSSLIARCENEKQVHIQRHKHWYALAACLCMVIICAIAIPFFNQMQIDPDIDNPQPPISTDNMIFTNQLNQEPLLGTYIPMLNQADFVPMSVEELYTYYGSSIKVDSNILTLQSEPRAFGIYENENRGVYYDTNSLCFASANAAQRFEVTIGKSAYFLRFPVTDYESNNSVKQSEINGVAITIFAYVDGAGENCYHAEFSANGVSYSMTSYDFPYDSYISAISSIISDNYTIDGILTGADSLHKAAGIVDSVDETANLITAVLDNGTGVTVYLPDNREFSRQVFREDHSPFLRFLFDVPELINNCIHFPIFL